MKPPKARNFGLPLAAALIALAGSATAATTVKLYSYASPGKYVATPGDGIDIQGPPSWESVLGGYHLKAQVNGGFWTFCLETNQYFDQNGIYNVTFSNMTDGGSGPDSGASDRISAGTAYLYELFATGSLFSDTSYDTSYSIAQGAELQLAVWSLEDESYANVGISPYLQEILNAKFGNPAAYKADYTGSDVGVMILTDSSGGKHQDQLYYYKPLTPQPAGDPVPDGGTSLILLGISLGGLGLARRFTRA